MPLKVIHGLANLTDIDPMLILQNRNEKLYEKLKIYIQNLNTIISTIVIRCKLLQFLFKNVIHNYDIKLNLWEKLIYIETPRDRLLNHNYLPESMIGVSRYISTNHRSRNSGSIDIHFNRGKCQFVLLQRGRSIFNKGGGRGGIILLFHIF